MTQPDFHEVGCRKCGNGGGWRIMFNGSAFSVAHSCGHEIALSAAAVAGRPDEKPVDMRFVT